MTEQKQSTAGYAAMADAPLSAPPKARLLNSREAAQYLMVAEPTLRKWRVTGGGPPFVKFGSGGRVCYRLKDLDAFIEARIQTSTSVQPG
jgi:excisionase family DNA binding protein